jgi:hypothetical protein
MVAFQEQDPTALPALDPPKPLYKHLADLQVRLTMRRAHRHMEAPVPGF